MMKAKTKNILLSGAAAMTVAVSMVGCGGSNPQYTSLPGGIVSTNPYVSQQVLPCPSAVAQGVATGVTKYTCNSNQTAASNANLVLPYTQVNVRAMDRISISVSGRLGDRSKVRLACTASDTYVLDNTDSVYVSVMNPLATNQNQNELVIPGVNHSFTAAIDGSLQISTQVNMPEYKIGCLTLKANLKVERCVNSANQVVACP